MSIARVETPSACSSNSSPGNRADASLSVAPQLRIDLRSTRTYSPASAAAIATATVRLFTSDTENGGPACAPSLHPASGMPRRDRIACGDPDRQDPASIESLRIPAVRADLLV